MNSDKAIMHLYTITDEELMLMSSQNPELRFERNADGTFETIYATGRISGSFSKFQHW